MDIKKDILSEVFKDIIFTPEETELIQNKFESVDLKKGDILLHAQEIVYDQYYVLEGCLRTYFTDDSGKDYTLQFAIKDWWISDYTAFFTTSEAKMSIECIKNAVVYKISRESMKSLYLDIPKLETFFRKKMEKAFASFQKRILSNLSKSATERYQYFVDTYPRIEQNVNNYHIASYLGITTESLSRIRKEIAQKSKVL